MSENSTNSTDGEKQDEPDAVPQLAPTAESDPTQQSEAPSESIAPPQPTDPVDLVLLPQHQKLIDDSAISPEVARQRGYRTVHKKVELATLGFSEPQRRVPALLIPVYGVSGEIATYQIRPEERRIGKDGKPVKYETPGKSRMALDVPPGIRNRIGDPSVPLLITEGVRKADAAVSKGLCCIALLGVWNWRGSNVLGGKTVLPDWESIALNGRKAYIVFDSDVMEKPAVHAALRRLKAFLESREAEVFIIYLPSGNAGAKVGLDDFLASGKSKDDLLALATPNLRAAPGSHSLSKPPYEEQDGRLLLIKLSAEGVQTAVPLCNFTARIQRDLTEDDGAESRRVFEIEAHVAGRAFQFRIAADRFGGLTWVIEQLGTRAIVQPGQTIKDHIRAAIQRFSEDDVVEARVYRHTGWRTIDGRLVYLHAGGALGAEGEIEGVEVALEPPLDRFELPPPPEGDDRVAAVRECIALLTCGLAPDRVVFPLFPFVWGVVIVEVSHTVTLVGTTGVRKTEIAALAQRHFGAGMDAANLPGAWSSTGNALEELAFLAKDAVLTVDDYNPQGSSQDVRRDQAKADRLVRAQGNRSGRQRLNKDLTMRGARPPRGLILSTAEEHYSGHSLRARDLMIAIGRDEVNLDRLTERQAKGASYSQAMAAFIRWVASRRDDLRREIRVAADQRRDELLSKAPHGRTATTCGLGMALLAVFLRFAKETGAIEQALVDELIGRGERAFLEVMGAQADLQADADPVNAYVRHLASSLNSCSAHLVDVATGEVPMRDGAIDDASARLVGWRLAEADDNGRTRREWRPGGSRIGFVDLNRGRVLLLQEAAYQAVQMSSGDSPERISRGIRTISKALDEAGLLLEKDKKRHTKKVRTAGLNSNVLVLRLDSLWSSGTGTTGTDDGIEADGGECADVFPFRVPDPAGTADGTGTENGNTSNADGDTAERSVPDVPVVPDHVVLSAADDEEEQTWQC